MTRNTSTTPNRTAPQTTTTTEKGEIRTDRLEQRLTQIIEQAQSHDELALKSRSETTPDEVLDQAFHRQQAFKLRAFARELQRDLTLLEKRTTK